MSEIIGKVKGTLEGQSKGTSFLDTVLNKETFDTLDKHAHTIDQVSALLDKTNKLMNNPLLQKVITIVEESGITQPAKSAIPNDGWNAPTMSEMQGQPAPRPLPRPPAPIQPQTQLINPEPSKSRPEPSKAESSLHSQVKDEIDKLSEEQLMDMMMKLADNPEVTEAVKEVKKEDKKELNKNYGKIGETKT